mgnify:CR=1 FL=1
MLFTGVFFVAGLLLLAAVNVRRGRAAALAADAAGTRFQSPAQGPMT